MGKYKDNKKRVKKIFAALNNVLETYDKRYEMFLYDFKKIKNIQNKKEKHIAMDRLVDELIGYTARVHNTLKVSENIYNKSRNKITTLENLNRELNLRFFDDNQNKMMNKLEHDRHIGCHTDPYLINEVILKDFENIRDLIENGISKLENIDMIKSISEFELKKEEKNQKDTRIDKFDKIIENKKIKVSYMKKTK